MVYSVIEGLSLLLSLPLSGRYSRVSLPPFKKKIFQIFQSLWLEFVLWIALELNKIVFNFRYYAQSRIECHSMDSDEISWVLYFEIKTHTNCCQLQIKWQNSYKRYLIEPHVAHSILKLKTEAPIWWISIFIVVFMAVTMSARHVYCKYFNKTNMT